MDVTKAIAQLMYDIPGLIVIFTLLYYIFQNAINAKIEVMKTKEIEPIKDKIAKEMELYKNELVRENEKFKRELDKEIELYKKELELDNARTKIIYDKQKDAFKNIIITMDAVIQKLSWSHNVEEDTYIPLNEADYKEIRDTVVGESLFISPKGWRSVEIFLKVLGKTVEWHLYDTEWSTPYFIKRIEELKFIHYNIQCYFRSEIGFSSDLNPLIEIEFFNSCRLLNSYHFQEAGVPTEKTLFQVKQKSTEQLVRDAKDNKEALINELKKFAEYIETNETEMFYDVFIELEEAIAILTEIR